MLNTGKIYLHKILGNMLCWTLWEDWFNKQTTLNTLCWTLWEDLFTQNTGGILYVEHCGKIYLHKILGEYFMLNTVGRFIYTKYWGNTSCWTVREDFFPQITGEYCMLNTVGRFIYTDHWGILYVEHCGKIYLHKILVNILCWALGIFIYIKYWEIRYVEHCGKIY
jgi:hypothetical protein